MKRKFSISLICLIAGFTLFAQNRDTTQPVTIIKSNNLYWKRISPDTELQILSGDVKLRQGNTLFSCDSCIINNTTNIFEAFGRVHISEDTTDVRSNYLRYYISSKMAYLSGNVRLTDGQATLTTPDLEYDVTNKIGTYKNGGKVVNKKSVLTSREGTYYTDLRDIYFRHNVELKDPSYYLKSDSLIYNSESQIARFIADTYIKDSTGRVIRTREGYYDVAKSHAEFFSRTTVEDGSMIASADRMASDDSTGIIQMEGRAVVNDTAQGQTVIADVIWVDKKNDRFLATVNPLMIIKQDDDSIYVRADTLFSARLTELYKNDSAMLAQLNLNEKDSTNRYFEAYRNVRVFSDSMQAASDSLYYSFKDSTFHLYYDPVVWSKKSQITGDTIYLYTKNKKADRVRVLENSFIADEVEPGIYQQIKSSFINGFFKEGQLDSVRAIGLAESIYFLQDEDSAYTGVNKTSSDAIDIYFEGGELNKVVFRSELKGTLYPLNHKPPSQMRLAGFRWLDGRRPKTKYEMFEN